VRYLYANYGLPIYRPFCSRLRLDVRDRQTSDAHHRLIPPTLGAGHENIAPAMPNGSYLRFVWRPDLTLNDLGGILDTLNRNRK